MICTLDQASIPVAPYALFGSAELASNVEANFQAPARAALLANHGVVAGGSTLAEAAVAAETVELLAGLLHRALVVGEPHVLSDEQLRAVADQIRARSVRTGRAMSDDEIVVHLDVGGSGLKLSAYNSTRHRSELTTRTAWPATSWSTDRSTFDVDTWWRTSITALDIFSARLGDHSRAVRPTALTVSAIRIPFVLLDGRGKTVLPCLSNGNRAAVAQVDELRVRYGYEFVYSLTGHWLTPEFGLPKLLWLRHNQADAFRRVRLLLQLHDWFIFKLCGAVRSEPSSAAMSQLLTADGEKWADELIADLGLSRSWLPDLTPAGTVAGGLQADVAASVGLPAGLPVHIGGGDTQMSALSAGALAPDDDRASPPAVVVAGTTAPVQRAVTGPPEPVDAQYPLLCSRQLLDGWWTLESNAGAVGSILQQLTELRPELRGAPLRRALRRFGMLVLPSRAQHSRHATPLLVTAGNPYFTPSSWARALPTTVANLLDTHTAADVQGAALRASAVAVAEVTGRLCPDTSELRVTGGLAGAPQWVQLLSDYTGKTVAVAEPGTTAGLGGASVVARRSLWTDADTAACRRYRPAEVAVDLEFRDAYLDFHDPGGSAARASERSTTCVL